MKNDASATNRAAWEDSKLGFEISPFVPLPVEEREVFVLDWNDRISRRKFLKRTGGATAATLLAVNAMKVEVLAEIQSLSIVEVTDVDFETPTWSTNGKMVSIIINVTSAKNKHATANLSRTISYWLEENGTKVANSTRTSATHIWPANSTSDYSETEGYDNQVLTSGTSTIIFCAKIDGKTFKTTIRIGS